jgi:hypothetical protein
MSDRKRPWSKWYWGDWRKDTRLHMCGYGARGLWGDMLSLMGEECDHFGYLILNGVPLGAQQLAATFGGSVKEVTKLLADLEANKVFSRIGDTDLKDDVTKHLISGIPVGTIISRRMIRDKGREEEDRENGRRGGNPRLKGGGEPPRKPLAPTGGLTGGDKAQSQSPDARGQSIDHGADDAGRSPDLLGEPPADSGPDLQAAVNSWNDLADRLGLAKVAMLNDERRPKLRQRMADAAKVLGGPPLTAWGRALDRVAASSFLRGDKTDFRADFDFLMQRKSFTKLLEGGYDDRPANGSGAHRAADGGAPGWSAERLAAERRYHEAATKARKGGALPGDPDYPKRAAYGLPELSDYATPSTGAQA